MVSYGCSFVLLIACTLLASTHGHAQKTFSGQLVSGVYMETGVSSFTSCQSLCWYSVSCMSCTWATRTGLCYLSSETRDTSPASFSVSPHYMYSDVMNPFGLNDQHPCMSRPCHTGEICVPVEAGTGHLCLYTGLTQPSMTPTTPAAATTTTTSVASTTGTTGRRSTYASTTTTTSPNPSTLNADTTAPTTTTSVAPTTVTTGGRSTYASTTTTTSSNSSTLNADTTTPTTTTSVAPTTVTTGGRSTYASTTTTTSPNSSTLNADTTAPTTTIKHSSTTSTTSETTTTTSTTMTTTTTAAETYACVTDCTGRDGRYHSCQGCHMYAVCNAGTLNDMPCPANTEWNDIIKTCVVAPSPTCL
ncbi:integumentary mucin C.1-like [Haliotis rufescens]|uniref:integumentary mucin C.1-like n=1 Tax=Haliotis rufescens TaxID=6454 RepID=UPI00201F4C30|nr:integumentary mucin C.1-like [Haliotis rufescens]